MSTLPIVQATVCMFLRRQGRKKYQELNLAMKTREPFSGLLLPHGGKVDPGETHLQCVVREVKDETDGVIIDPSALTKVCIVHSHTINGEGHTSLSEIHFYTVEEWSGEIRSTEEMRDPKWYSISKLPYHKMPLGDEHYFAPILLEGKKLEVKVHYGPRRLTLLQKPQIREVSSLQ